MCKYLSLLIVNNKAALIFLTLCFFTSRLLSLQSENVSLRSEATQVQADLSSQIEAQRQTYRDQLRKLQDEHRATVETLQGQFTRVEEQLFNLQSQNSKYRNKLKTV